MIDIDLKRMRFLMGRIPVALMEIERAESRATKTTATISDMPHGSVNGSAVENSVIRISDLLDAYQAIIDELEQRRTQLRPVIDRMPNGDERAIIQLRYINGYSVQQIGTSIYKCDRQVYRYLKAAEKSVMKIANSVE